MLYIASREEGGYFDLSSLRNFSCPALRTIDTLWVEYSDGTFGFSEQKRVLDEILAESEQPERSYTELTSQEWGKFYERVGWVERGEIVEKKLKSYSDYTFNPKKAQRGHLPAGLARRSLEGWWDVMRGELFSLTAHCRL